MGRLHGDSNFWGGRALPVADALIRPQPWLRSILSGASIESAFWKSGAVLPDPVKRQRSGEMRLEDD